MYSSIIISLRQSTQWIQLNFHTNPFAAILVQEDPPIDFTQPGHNTYLRGRTNQSGNTPPSGFIGQGMFIPSGNVITSG